MKRVLKYSGYSLFFLSMLVLFLMLSFPADEVRRYAEKKLSKQLGGTVHIANLELSLTGDITLEGLQIELPMPEEKPSAHSASNRMRGPGAPSESEPPQNSEDDQEENESGPTNPPMFLIADKLEIDWNPLGMAMGNPLNVVINGEIQNGTVSNLRITQVDKGWHVRVDQIEGVNLAPTRLLKRFIGTDIWTVVSADKDLDFIWRGSIANSEGTIALSLAETLIPHVVFKDPKGNPLAEAFNMDVGDLSLRMTLEKQANASRRRSSTSNAEENRLTIEELKARGEHLLLNMDGGQKHTIRFHSPALDTGLVDFKFVFSFTKEFFEWEGTGVREDGSEVPNVKHIGLKYTLEGPHSPMARGRIGQKQTGFRYGYHCTGMLRDMKCVPEKPSRAILPQMGSGSPVTGKRPAVGNRPKVNNAPKPRNRPSVSPPRSNNNDRRQNDRAKPSAKRKSNKSRLVEPTRPKSGVSTNRISRKAIPKDREEDTDETESVPLEPSVPPSSDDESESAVDEDEEDEDDDDDEEDEDELDDLSDEEEEDEEDE